MKIRSLAERSMLECVDGAGARPVSYQVALDGLAGAQVPVARSNREERGHSRYHPAMMTALLLYA